MRRYLITGVLTGTIVAAIYAAPAATQGRPAAPAVRIQAGDGGTLGLAHTIRIEGAAAPSLGRYLPAGRWSGACARTPCVELYGKTALAPECSPPAAAAEAPSVE